MKNEITHLENIVRCMDISKPISIFDIGKDDYFIIEYSTIDRYGYRVRRVNNKTFHIDGNTLGYSCSRNGYTQINCSNILFYDNKESVKYMENIMRQRIFNSSKFISILICKITELETVIDCTDSSKCFKHIKSFLKCHIKDLDIKIQNPLELFDSCIEDHRWYINDIKTLVDRILKQEFNNYLDNGDISIKYPLSLNEDISTLKHNIFDDIVYNLNIIDYFSISGSKVFCRNTIDNNTKYPNIFELWMPIANRYNLSKSDLRYVMSNSIKDIRDLAINILLKKKRSLTKDHLKYMKIDNCTLRNDNVCLHILI